MEVLKLSFVLLLPLAATFLDSEVTLVKTIGKEPDVTPLCTNETHTLITLIVCKIRTERSRREECHLLYRYGHDFVHECDSRFTLMTENQTVFLHLNDLTSADSGNYTCECSNNNGTFVLHLNITVEVAEDKKITSTKGIPFLFPLVVAVKVIIIVGITLGVCYRRKKLIVTTAHETPGSL
ncbi:uncharacterized protein PAE49_012766 isoform 2-T2 [Odontesthes bonariensis]